MRPDGAIAASKRAECSPKRCEREGLDVKQAWTPPIPAADLSADVVYADQVLEHMSGIDAARAIRRRSRSASFGASGVFLSWCPTI